MSICVKDIDIRTRISQNTNATFNLYNTIYNNCGKIKNYRRFLFAYEVHNFSLMKGINILHTAIQHELSRSNRI